MEIQRLCDEISLLVLPGRFLPGGKFSRVYNQAFHFWESFWVEVLAVNQSHEKLDRNDYLRSDIVTFYLWRNRPVALHLYSLLNLELDCIDAHPYLSRAQGGIFIDALRAHDIKSAMSLEYLTLLPDLRKSQIGFYFSSVIISIGLKIQQSLGIGASLSRAREDVGVHKRLKDLGSLTLASGIVLHNTPTEFCINQLSMIRPDPDEKVQFLVKGLWKKKQSYYDFESLNLAA